MFLDPEKFKFKIPNLASLFDRGDKRKAMRLSMMRGFHIFFRDKNGGPTDTGEVRDISPYGIKFALGRKLSRGTVLDVELRFPEIYPKDKIVKTSVRVVRCIQEKDQSRYRIGCEMNLPQEDITKVSDFIRWVQQDLRDKT